MGRRWFAVVVVLVVLAAVPSSAATPAGDHRATLPGVTLLPPIGSKPAPRTAFDPNADLRIEIFALASDRAVGSPVGPSFSVAASGKQRIKVEGLKGKSPRYRASWKTRDSRRPDGSTVRVEIRLPSAPAGPSCNDGVGLGRGCIGYFDVGLRKGGKSGSWPAGVMVVENGQGLEIKLHIASGALEATGPPPSQLPGDPGSPAAAAIPDLHLKFRKDDYAPHPDLGGLMVSFDTLFLVFKRETTVGEANALLAEIGAQIIGGVPGKAGEAEGILLLRVPVGSHAEMDALINRLRADPRVEVAVQDSLLGATRVPRPPKDIVGWSWDLPPFGANWGLEAIRMPQLWNLNRALEKPGGGRRASIGVLDVGFFDHDDLTYDVKLGPLGGPDADHGTHVAGTIAAEYDNELGVDGVDPYVRLVVQRDKDTSGGWGLFELLAGASDLDVVNISMGYNWYLGTDTDPPVNPSLIPEAQELARGEAAIFELWQKLLVLRGDRLPLIVAAAGNDSGDLALLGVDVDAKWASPFTYAGLVDGVSNVIVVEALGLGDDGKLRRAPFSNTHGNISAPGVDIASTGPPTLRPPYAVMSGTSMAAPHVAGVAGYLLSLDPTLTPVELRGLLMASAVPVEGGASPGLDAFAAALSIDDLRGNSAVLKRLLDVDDGSDDGDLRVDCTSDCTEVTNEDFDGDGGQGDGQIDMSDFRRFRDWLLLTEEANGLMLDGAATHPKKDVNRNGAVEGVVEAFPDGDFNGNGLLFDRDRRVFVPGYVNAEATDLEVLQSLFADPDYSAAELPELIDSADVHVDPSGCMAAPGAIGVQTKIFDASTGIWVDDRYDTVAPMSHIYTLPVTPDGYTVRAEALDKDGTVVGVAQNSFPAKLGSDSWFAPTCGRITLDPRQVNVVLDAGDSTTRSFTLTSEGMAADWTVVGSLEHVEASPTGGYLEPGDEATIDATITCPAKDGSYGGYLDLAFFDAGGKLIEAGVPEHLIVDIVCLPVGVTAEPDVLSVTIPADESAVREFTLTNKGTALQYEARPGEHVTIEQGASGELATRGGQATVTVELTCPEKPGPYKSAIPLTFTREDGKPVKVPVPESIPVELDCTGPIHLVRQWLLNTSNINPFDRDERWYLSEDAQGTAEFRHSYGVGSLTTDKTTVPPIGFGTIESQTELTVTGDRFGRWPADRTVSVEATLSYRASYDGTTARFEADFAHTYIQNKVAFVPLLPESASGLTNIRFTLDKPAHIVASWSCDGQFGWMPGADPQIRLLREGQSVFQSSAGQTSGCEFDGMVPAGSFDFWASTGVGRGDSTNWLPLSLSQSATYSMALTFP